MPETPYKINIGGKYNSRYNPASEMDTSDSTNILKFC